MSGDHHIIARRLLDHIRECPGLGLDVDSAGDLLLLATKPCQIGAGLMANIVEYSGELADLLQADASLRLTERDYLAGQIAEAMRGVRQECQTPEQVAAAEAHDRQQAEQLASVMATPEPGATPH